MESENPSVHSSDFGRDLVETLVPAGLTGAIREKAVDAMFLSLGVLHMSMEDVQQRIREIAAVHHQPPDSPQVWLKFHREIRALYLTRDPVKDLADQLQPKERSGFLASVATAKKTLGYSPEDVKSLLGVAWRGNVNDPSGAAQAFSAGVSGEVGDHANSVSGRNGVHSWDQKATGWGGGGQDGSGVAEYGIADAANMDEDLHEEMIGEDSDREAEPDRAELARAEVDREAERDRAEVDVETIHQKAAHYLSDRNYIGYRTFMENAEILDMDHKGRGKAAKNRDGSEEPDPARIAAKLKTNLWLSSDASARGARPDIMERIRELQDLPEPSVPTRKAMERMDTPLDRLVENFGKKKGKSRDERGLER